MGIFKGTRVAKDCYSRVHNINYTYTCEHIYFFAVRLLSHPHAIPIRTLRLSFVVTRDSQILKYYLMAQASTAPSETKVSIPSFATTDGVEYFCIRVNCWHEKEWTVRFNLNLYKNFIF